MAIDAVSSGIFGTLSQLDRQELTAVAQLGSGNRLISAAIDAAGLGVAEQLASQINGFEQAQSNAELAQSELATAGSAVQSQQDILQQERQLAVEASNDTLTASDRQAIQAQIDQLNQGINDIANQTQFNTQPLLNGQAGGVQISGGGAQAMNISAQAGVTHGTAAITVTALGTSGQLTGGAPISSGTFQGGGSVTITGPNGSATLATQNGETVGEFVQQVNAAGIGVNAAVNGQGELQLTTNGVGTNQRVTITQASGTDVTNTLALSSGATAAGTNATAVVNGVAQTAQGNRFTVVGAGSLTGLQFTATATGTTTVTVTPSNAQQFQVGANQGQTIQSRLDASNTEQLGINNLDLTTQAGAENAIGQLDQAIQTTSSQLADIGAEENRLTNAGNNAATAQENAPAANSLLSDTNIAQASSSLAQSLLLQTFSLFSLQQQANAFALQSQLLIA
jgi:flagellin